MFLKLAGPSLMSLLFTMNRIKWIQYISQLAQAIEMFAQIGLLKLENKALHVCNRRHAYFHYSDISDLSPEIINCNIYNQQNQ